MLNHSKDLRNINLNDSEIQVEKKTSELYLLDTQSNIGYMFTVRIAKNSI